MADARRDAFHVCVADVALYVPWCKHLEGITVHCMPTVLPTEDCCLLLSLPLRPFGGCSGGSLSTPKFVRRKRKSWDISVLGDHWSVQLGNLSLEGSFGHHHERSCIHSRYED